MNDNINPAWAALFANAASSRPQVRSGYGYRNPQEEDVRSRYAAWMLGQEREQRDRANSMQDQDRANASSLANRQMGLQEQNAGNQNAYRNRMLDMMGGGQGSAYGQGQGWQGGRFMGGQSGGQMSGGGQSPYGAMPQFQFSVDDGMGKQLQNYLMQFLR